MQHSTSGQRRWSRFTARLLGKLPIALALETLPSWQRKDLDYGKTGGVSKLVTAIFHVLLSVFVYESLLVVTLRKGDKNLQKD